MRHAHFILVATLAAAWHVPQAVSQTAPYPRRFLARQWHQVGPAVLDETGDRLLNPQVIAALPNLALVLDWGDRHLKALAPTGNVVWSFGHHGAGPGELGAPGMVVVGADGLAWLTDRGNLRAYGLDSLGQLRRTVQLGVTLERAFPRSDGLRFGQPALDSTPLLVDTLGRVRGRYPLAPSAKAADRFVRVDIRALPLSGSRVVLLYSWASVLVAYDSLRRMQVTSGPDGVPFPPMKRVGVGPGIVRLDPATTRPRVGVSLASDGTRLFVLTGPPKHLDDDDLADLVDVFDSATLAYLGSWRLPRRVYDIACDGGQLIALFRTPAPGVIRWWLE